MARKLNVAVLMGGKSSEHAISLLSGKQVAKNLNPRKYNVLPVIISQDGAKWQIDKQIKNQTRSQMRSSAFLKAGYASALSENNIDLVFIALHGPNGEDGNIQGFLELIGIPYTGSKVLASALGINKILSRQIFEKAKIKVPGYLAFKKYDNPTIIWHKFKIPIVVKPFDQGSSIGVTKVTKKQDLQAALKKAFSYSKNVIIEDYIDGIEITCAILGNDKPQALPLIEIVPKKDFFDYEAKYNEIMCDEICPARISQDLTKKAQKIAIKAYSSLGCEGFGRVDMIIKDNDVYTLEVNTIPGLTQVSLFPKAASTAGISYSQLLNKIIGFANP